jgi:hypothetical protein
MPRLVYACRFEVPTKAGLDAVADAYQDWLARHYRERRGIAEFAFDPKQTSQALDLPEQHYLASTVYKSGAGTAVRIRWSYPDNNDAGLRWTNEIRIGQFGNRCSIEHLILIESVDYNVAPVRLLFGSPRVVRDICSKTPAYIGDMQVRATPYLLEKRGFDDFISLQSSDLRRLPIVLLSPYAHGDANMIDSAHVARNLAGVAVVVHVTDPDVTWDIADELGRQLSCFNGAARIYWPNFQKGDDLRSHRLFLGAWIEQVGGAAASGIVERAVFAVAAFRFVPDQRISDVIGAVETAERQKQLEEKKAAGDDFWEDYERDLARLDEATGKIRELEAENANLRANQNLLFAGTLTADEPDEGVKDELVSISSVTEAVERAAKRTRKVEFLASAHSAAGESPFQRPFDIFKALMDLDEIVDAWRSQRDSTGSGGDLLQHLRDRGWGRRSSMHISDTTKGKYRGYYEFDYKGLKQLFEPHITIGSGDPNSCASIHFIFDHNREKMVVAHVGKHLPNTKM